MEKIEIKQRILRELFILVGFVCIFMIAIFVRLPNIRFISPILFFLAIFGYPSYLLIRLIIWVAIELKKKRFKRILTSLFFVSLIFMGVSIYKSSKEKVLEFPYPFILKLEGVHSKYYCEALLGTTIMSPAMTIGDIKKGVQGKVFKGTDKLSIEIKDDKLYFLTKASFEAGDSRDENPFTIIYNDEHKVLAIDKIDESLIVNVFTLNKDTGVANWAKIRNEGFLTGNPDTQSYCLKCEPRL
jgi:hypothetical protein